MISKVYIMHAGRKNVKLILIPWSSAILQGVSGKEKENTFCSVDLHSSSFRKAFVSVGHKWWILQCHQHGLFDGSACNGNLKLSVQHQRTCGGPPQPQRWMNSQGTMPVVEDQCWTKLKDRKPRNNKPTVSSKRFHSSKESVSCPCWRLYGKFRHIY